jgi:hypothetical protein
MRHDGWDHALKVTGDGAGLVGHAGGVLLRKLADQCGLGAARDRGGAGSGRLGGEAGAGRRPHGDKGEKLKWVVCVPRILLSTALTSGVGLPHRLAVTITGHVPMVGLSSHHAGDDVAEAVPA